MAFQIIMREVLACMSAFTNVGQEQLANKTNDLKIFIQNALHACKDSDFNPGFVPKAEDRILIAKIAHSLNLSLTWNSLFNDFDYVVDNVAYPLGGYYILRIQFNENNQEGVKAESIRPNHIQQIIFSFWFKLVKQFKNEFIFDDFSPPYLFTTSTSYTPAQPKISWNNENKMKYKEELGQWAEVYSGQFDDYKEEVYIGRLEGDLSNRMSEMHIINRNSAFIFMNPENYDSFFIKDERTPKSTGYIFTGLVQNVCKVRTIAFAINTVNTLIDRDTNDLASETASRKDIAAIQEKLSATNRVKNDLLNTLAPLYTDISRSHRQHYTNVLNRSMEIFSIETNWDRINSKIESNMAEMNSIYLEKQQESAEKQEKILNIVNFLLGGSFIFELLSYLLYRNEDLLNNVNFTISLIFTGLALFIYSIFRMKMKKE